MLCELIYYTNIPTVFTSSANFFIIGHGCSVGWVSPSLPILQSEDSPIGPISRDDASWIGSLFSLGAGFGVLTFGMISVWIGNKKSLILCVFPALVSDKDFYVMKD